MSPRIEETSAPRQLPDTPAGLDDTRQTPSATTSPLGHRVFRRIAAALHHRDFRVLWFGACTSSIGTWMQSLAENWLVLTLTASAFYLGLDSFLQQVPILLFTLIGGVVADRYDRRRTLLTSQCVQMFSACTLAILLYTGVVQIWHILALSFLTGCAQSFGGPAYQSLIPSIVGREDLTNAIALNSIQFNIARFIGPLLAGAALAMLGRWGLAEASAMSVIFGVNGLSFLVVIMALLSLRVKHVPGTRTHSLLQELQIGLAYVRSEKTVLGLLVLSGLATFLGFPLITLLPVFAKDVFGRGVEGYSTLMAFSGAGAIIGALIVAWLGKHGRMGLSDAAPDDRVRHADHPVCDLAIRMDEPRAAFRCGNLSDDRLLDAHLAGPADRAQRDARPRHEHLSRGVPRGYAAREPRERVSREPGPGADCSGRDWQSALTGRSWLSHQESQHPTAVEHF